MEAGALGEFLYLSSESLNLGACGKGAFYDFELQNFLGLSKTELPIHIVSAGICET
ncbi:nitroreductase family protein [Desulfurobacterium crinifex]